MKTCKKCGCVYDNSFDKCPTCNYTINKEMNKDVFMGCLNGLIICISIALSLVESSIGPIILGIIICLIISQKLNKDKRISTTQNAGVFTLSSNTPSSKLSCDDEAIKKYYLTNAKNDSRRIDRAKYETFSFKQLNTENKSADVLNHEKTKVYHTTLTSCTCPDFAERQLPCKHMYRLAEELGYFDLYYAEEKELIEKLWSIKDNSQLIAKLIDVFYRIRDKKDKYYVKTSPLLNELAEFDLIKFKEIPEQELVNIKYNTNELKGILHDKNFKKSITKKELIELFLSDKKLIKKLPKNMVHVTLTCTDKQKEYFTQTLNYFLYN